MRFDRARWTSLALQGRLIGGEIGPEQGQNRGMIVVTSYGRRLACSLVQRGGLHGNHARHKESPIEGQLARGLMDRQLIHHHYLMLGLNLVVSTIIMYSVMFTMNWSFGDSFNNPNMLCMALMMATPMGVLILLMMRPMYPNYRLNLLLHGFLHFFSLPHSSACERKASPVIASSSDR